MKKLRVRDASKKQVVICNVCKSEFKASVGAVKKGKAKFCSKTCSAKYSVDCKTMKSKTCKSCGKDYKTKNNNSVYCSSKCKSKHSATKRKIAEEDKNDIKLLKKRGCEICHWKDASRDLHHIVPVKKGGSNGPENLITLCPNHHRMADQGLISDDELFHYMKVRAARIGF